MKVARRYPMVQGIRVDVQALRALAHRCDPMACRFSKGCCKSYEVLVDRKEITNIIGALPQAARFAKGLREGGQFVDPFDDTEGGTCLNTHEDGLCVFAYKDSCGATLCSLHSAALKLGLPPIWIKPKACVLWPLFLVETKPPLLTVQHDATTFPCNTLRRNMTTALDEGVADIVRAVFGDLFLRRLQALIGRKSMT